MGSVGVISVRANPTGTAASTRGGHRIRIIRTVSKKRVEIDFDTFVGRKLLLAEVGRGFENQNEYVGPWAGAA